MSPARPVVSLLVVGLVLGLAACTLPRPGTAVPAAPAGRVAVLPFRTGGTLTSEGAFVSGSDAEAGPGDHGAVAAGVLTERLAALGVPFTDPGRVAAAAMLADAGAYDARLGARVAARVGADFAVLGALGRYREREGTALGVRSPASVAYQLVVVRAADRAVVTVDSFEYTQQPLSENLLDLPMFLRGGGRWMTRKEILEAALGSSAEKIAAALRAAPPVSRPR